MCRQVLISLLLLRIASVAAAESPYFGIRVVDAQTGRGVPLVELRTVNRIRHYTDSAGYVAFREPGLAGREVFFHVASHGYEHPADGFGYRGARLVVEPGGSATIKITRLNVAERLYRVTGGGIYRDSILLGQPTPLAEPALNGRVFGQDSVVNTIYRGKIYWFWGDTSRPGYPLGNFQVAGATSHLPTDGGLSPHQGVDLTYFVNDNGFAREMAPTPGHGPTWIDGLVTLRDPNGDEHLFANYAKVNTDMSAQRRGLLEFDDAAEQFKPITEIPLDAPIQPGGHPLFHRDGEVDYIYYTRPFPVIRVPATIAALRDLAQYECYTCLQPGSTTEEPVLDRDANGVLRWAWRRNAPQLLPRIQEKLISDGRMTPAEARFRLCDVATGKPVIVHGGSVYFNAYRNRYVMIALEIMGTSMLGEIWFAEAPTPTGPWRYARKIVTHDRYSFYNPKQHPMFDQDDGRVIYFEGTYTATFSGNDDHTPRYDYNQIMYALDLADPRTVLPTPVYAQPGGAGLRLAPPGTDTSPHASARATAPAFFALDRPIPGCVAIVADRTGGQFKLAALPPTPDNSSQTALFYALPANPSEPPPPTTVPLYVHRHRDGRRVYRPAGAAVPAGFDQADQPLCHVWHNVPQAPATTTPSTE